MTKLTKGQVYLHKSECNCFRCSGISWNKGKKTGLVPRSAFKKGDHKLNLIGQQFGRLKVIDNAPEHITKGGRAVAMYKCICLCGKKVIQYSGALRQGTVVSCGCYNKENAIKWGKAHKGIKRPEFSGEKNPSWKGDKVGYFALHTWLKRTFKKATKCDFCQRSNLRIEWANISGKYKRDRNDFVVICRSCHFYFDRMTLKERLLKIKTSVY